jgi:hypothetical protein
MVVAWLQLIAADLDTGERISTEFASEDYTTREVMAKPRGTLSASGGQVPQLDAWPYPVRNGSTACIGKTGRRGKRSASGPRCKQPARPMTRRQTIPRVENPLVGLAC